jgi:hypothetical protein
MNLSKKLKNIFLVGLLSFAVVVPGLAVEPEGFLVKGAKRYTMDDKPYSEITGLLQVPEPRQVQGFRVHARFVFDLSEESQAILFENFFGVAKSKRGELIKFDDFKQYLPFLHYINPKDKDVSLPAGVYFLDDGTESGRKLIESDEFYDEHIDKNKEHPWDRYDGYFTRKPIGNGLNFEQKVDKDDGSSEEEEDDEIKYHEKEIFVPVEFPARNGMFGGYEILGEPLSPEDDIDVAISATQKEIDEIKTRLELNANLDDDYRKLSEEQLMKQFVRLEELNERLDYLNGKKRSIEERRQLQYIQKKQCMVLNEEDTTPFVEFEFKPEMKIEKEIFTLPREMEKDKKSEEELEFEKQLEIEKNEPTKEELEAELKKIDESLQFLEQEKRKIGQEIEKRAELVIILDLSTKNMAKAEDFDPKTDSAYLKASEQLYGHKETLRGLNKRFTEITNEMQQLKQRREELTK